MKGVVQMGTVIQFPANRMKNPDAVERLAETLADRLFDAVEQAEAMDRPAIVYPRVDMSEAIIEEPKETAKKIRRALKVAYPGVKFSVTTTTFSMGSSVDISWTDGPMATDVEEITNAFQSCSFDGMTDSENNHGYWYDGRLYRGAHYVECNRRLSPESVAKIEAITREIWESL